ncbi:hypothetical protein ACTJIJ_23015 [Niabella sp. 22666]|uniref:hypothetical protein n=1 Tax=Niabella sp. 22666 TaxID=3453954 RepID=UPI003F85E737
MTIAESIRELVGDMRTYGIPCKVTKVSGKTCEVEPVNGDAPIVDVRLVADDKPSQFYLEPKVGSIVLVQQITDTAAYVSMFSEVEGLYLSTFNGGKFEVDSKFAIANAGSSLKDILMDIIGAVQPIVVLYGSNPDYDKLASALSKTATLFK